MRQTRMAPRSSHNSLLTRGQLTAFLLLLLLIVFALLMLDRRSLLDPVKGAAGRPIAALGHGFTALGDGIRHFGDRFGNVAPLQAENDRLQAQNQQLPAAEARVKDLESENAQLTDQANFAVKFPEYQSVPARVIGRDPTSSEKVLVLDRGSDDGLVVGMPVVSPNFLVGVITEVYPQRSKVRLIIDQDMQVGVLLQDKRSAGVMYGNWQQGGRLIVKHIDRDVQIDTGAQIITSNLTSHIPQGLLVGYVASVKMDARTDTQQLEVVPYVNFDTIGAVSIILTSER
jgi:rod shape-determining protein MreC